MNRHVLAYFILIIGCIFGGTSANTKLINTNNRILLIATTLEEPFMMLKKNYTNTRDPASISSGTIVDPLFVEGYCAELAHVICHEKLHLPYKFIIETKYGREVEKGVWDGIIGTLVNRQADLSIAPLVMTPARERVVEFSKPFMDSGIAIMIHKPEQERFAFFSRNRLSRLIEIGIFAIIIYLFLRLFLFLISQSSSYLCRFESKTNGMQQNELSMLDTLFLSLSVFVRHINTLPRSLPDRATKCAWCGFIFIILLLCAINLVVFSKSKTTPVDIKSIEDLAKQTDIRYGTIRNSSTSAFFKTSTFKVYQDMWHFMEQHKDDVFVASSHEGAEKVRRSNGKYAFLAESTFIDYANERLPCETTRLGDNLHTNSYGIAMPFGSNLRDPIGKAMSELRQNGFLELLKRKWYYERSECRNVNAKDSKQNIISSLFSIGTMLYVFVMIFSVTIMISVFEFLLKLKMCSSGTKQNTENSTS